MSPTTDSRHVLVGDIGGTHARFALAAWQAGLPVIQEAATYHCRDFPDLTDALRQYLAALPVPQPMAACLAVAGPVTSDHFRFTNNHWQFSRRQLAAQLNLDQLEVLNDLAAQACAIPLLAPSQYRTIRSGTARPGCPVALMGPGTGLGVATLVPDGQQWIPVSGEGGHVRPAPHNERMVEILTLLNREQAYVSLESLLSGPGLLRLYRALARLNGEATRHDSDKDILRLGVDNSDPLCRETLMVFCGLLGSAAGDLALTNGARGGLWLSGGILPRMPELLVQSHFERFFLEKGVMSHYLRDIPVQLITGEATALLGAAAWLRRQVSDSR